MDHGPGARRLLILAAAVAVGAPRWASAGCTTGVEAVAVRKSVASAVRCHDRALRAGVEARCTPVGPPACAATLVRDVVALGYGANDSLPSPGVDRRALRDQLRCQRQIGRTLRTVVAKRLAALVKGRPQRAPDAEPRPQSRAAAQRCSVTVARDASGVVVPAVGPQCAAAVGAPGNGVDPVLLHDCLVTLAQVWVDRVAPSARPLRPNILFILTDDQRRDTVDAAIMPRTRAALGDAGVECTSAFMTTPLCCPSRSSILTGQYAHRTGVFTNLGPFGGANAFDDSSTIGTQLKAAGYRTGMLGKYLNGYGALWTDPAPPYVPPGWDEWHVFRNPGYFNYTLVRNGVGFDHVLEAHGTSAADYSTDVLREIAREFITSSVAMGQPFYLQLDFNAPHVPRQPAPRHVGRFANVAPWRPPSYDEADVSDKPTWVQAMPPLDAAAQADLDNLRQRELEMLQAVDEAIGGSSEFHITGLMQTLRELGIERNTLVVYFSDNGYQWGEHRLRAKTKPYEESIRAPMFVRYPVLAPLRRTEPAMVLNIDLAPTFAELAGAPVPIAQDGVSLVQRIDATAPSWRTDFLTEGWPASHVWATVRERQWKYTELPTAPGDPATGFERELYDLDADPFELVNVAADPLHAARIAAMAARLRELRPLWPRDAYPLFEDQDEE